MEGVIAYQCEQGLVPEGRVEAMCGVDGRWSPDPTQHMCNTLVTITPTTTDATGTTMSYVLPPPQHVHVKLAINFDNVACKKSFYRCT